MITEQQLDVHFGYLASLPLDTEVTHKDGETVSLRKAFDTVIETLINAHATGKKVCFIGNGGSAGIASHMAIDYSKNGGIRSIAFNDAIALTCTGNDFGYENGFARLMDIYADKGDILIAISSSGKSPNILNAVKAARELDCPVYTLSGFGKDNPLRTMGDLNFYVPAKEYGFVECTHMALLHAMLDLHMGVK